MTTKTRIELAGGISAAVVIWILFGAPLPFDLPDYIKKIIRAIEHFLTIEIGLPDFSTITLQRLGNDPTWHILTWAPPDDGASATDPPTANAPNDPPTPAATGSLPTATQPGGAPTNSDYPTVTNAAGETTYDPSIGPEVVNP